jgi:hypothetical protein
MVAALAEGKSRRIAVSMFPAADEHTVLAEKARIIRALARHVEFFDSTTHPIGDGSCAYPAVMDLIASRRWAASWAPGNPNRRPSQGGAFCRIHPPLLWPDLREPSMSGGQPQLYFHLQLVHRREPAGGDNPRKCPRIVSPGSPV